MKKICFVIPSLNAGGMERVISELANYFCKKNNISVYLIIMVKGEIFFDLSSKIIVYMPQFHFNNSYRLLYTIKTLFFVRSRVKTIKPDAILSFGEMYNSFVLLSTLYLKTKNFISDRSKPDKSWGRFHDFLRKMLYPRAFGIISQTSYSKNFLTKMTNHRNVKIIHNPVKLPKRKDIDKKNIILNVGRLIPTKRIDILISIFSEINNDKWTLWIVGDGPQEKILKNQVAKLRIEDKVVFWGKQKHVSKFYKKSKIFAFTSISEGYPNALVEAMAYNLACIAFDCVAGPSDLIRDGVNGFLVPELNLNEYKKKLDNLLNNPELIEIFSEKASLAIQKLQMDRIGEQFLNFLLS